MAQPGKMPFQLTKGEESGEGNENAKEEANVNYT